MTMFLLSTPVTLAKDAFTNGQSASIVIGQKDFTASTHATTESGLGAPREVKFDSSGNLWVADSDNNRVLEFKPPFSSGMDASLVIGQASFVTSAPATTQSGLSNPGGVWSGPADLAFDSSGNLWVSDIGNSRVLEFKPPFSNGMPASLVIGQSDFTTFAPMLTQNGLGFPNALAFDPSGNLWVSSWSSSRVLEFRPPFSNGMNASLVIGQADFTTSGIGRTQTGLNTPTRLAFDPSGNLWVGDTGNNRVLEFKPPFSNGMPASLVIGQSDFTTTAALLPTKHSLSGSSGSDNPVFSVSFDSAGNLWVGDCLNNRVLEFEPPFSTGMDASLVIGQNDFTSRISSTTQAGLGCPLSSFDSAGNMWVADFFNNRVLEFSSPGSSVTSTAASSTTQTQSSQASATATTTDQGFGQLQYAAVGAVAVVVVVGLVAVFLRRSKVR